jgi:hypothetical protein
VVESATLGARRGKIRFTLRDDAAGATPLDLPTRKLWPVNLILPVIFAIFASVAWTVGGRMFETSVRDVFDLTFILFEGFWLLGWSVGVAILGVLTVLVFFYGESARLQRGQLVYVPRLGPLKIVAEYDLAHVRNVRAESAGSDQARLRFDDDDGTHTLGDTMAREQADRLVRAIQAATAVAGSTVAAPVPTLPKPRDTEPTPAVGADPEQDEPVPALRSLSGLALVGANLVPLAGVLFFGWDLANVIVLFWAESAVIGFYTLLKIIVVGRLGALIAAPFFIGHFGGFMAGHFLLIYGLFVRGLDSPGSPPGAAAALRQIFYPLWPALAGLFISHGLSFADNFIGRREYARTTTNGLMIAPYARIVVMQLALIFGGWMILLLRSPVPALALLIVFKTVLDFSAHRKEHQ